MRAQHPARRLGAFEATPPTLDAGIASLPIFRPVPATPDRPAPAHAARPSPLDATALLLRQSAGTSSTPSDAPEHRPRTDDGSATPAPVPTAGTASPVPPPHPTDPETVDWDVVQRLRGTVSNLLSQALASDPGMTEEHQRASAQAHIAEVVRTHVDDQLAIGGPAAVWSPATRHRVARAIFDALFRLGRLQPLVDDPTVENIDIYGCDQVWVSRADGSRTREAPVAASDAELIADIAFLAQRGGEDGRSFTPSTPILDMDLPGNARLAAVHPPISPRPKIVVRLHRFVDIELDELVRSHRTLSVDAAAFLRSAVEAGVSIVVAGAPGAGKTTLVRAHANCIPPPEEIVTIEKERELHLDRMGDRHHIVTPLQYRPGQGEIGADGRRAGEITLVDLLEEALRLNAERIIVGEVRGGEIDAMFQAMQAGVGSISTLHAHSPTDTIERLAGLTLKVLGATDAYAYRQIARHIGLIVQVRKVRDGRGRLRREVTHISQVQPGEETRAGLARPVAADVFARRHGELQAVSLPTGELLARLEEQGFHLDRLRSETAAGLR